MTAVRARLVTFGRAMSAQAHGGPWTGRPAPSGLAGQAAGPEGAADPPGAGSRKAARRKAAWDALAPVRAALLREARQRADGIIARAREQAGQEMARARAEAARQLSAARRAGEEQAAPLAAARRGEARRRSRSLVLAARRAALEELRERVRAAVSGLPAEPGYAELRARLGEAARWLAGPDALVEDAPGGGVVARAPGVLVDLSLARLADAAVDALGPDVEHLWPAAEGRRAGPPEDGPGPSRRAAPGGGRG